MMKTIRIISLAVVLLSLVSCSGKLTDKKATELLTKAYTAGNDPNNNGGAFTILDGITIDSIHQQSDKATIYYHVSGRVDNGSKYQVTINPDAQQSECIKGVFGWKLK